MKKTSSLIIVTISTIGLLIGMIGCGEDEEEPARILETDPGKGDEMFADGDLAITFDRTVTDVKVNRIPADVAGTKATWKGRGLQAGKQMLTIEWTDENGNTGSEEVTLTVRVFNKIVCFHTKGEEYEDSAKTMRQPVWS